MKNKKETMQAYKPKILFLDCIDHGFAGNKPEGYHQLRIKGKLRYVHRLAYADHHNLEESDLPLIRHLCNNPRCVNPNHLEPGTHKDNANDRVLTQRSAKQLPAKRSLSPEQQAKVKERYALYRQNSVAQMMADYGVSATVIYNSIYKDIA
jgi:hypothetical protein